MLEAKEQHLLLTEPQDLETEEDLKKILIVICKDLLIKWLTRLGPF